MTITNNLFALPLLTIATSFVAPAHPPLTIHIEGLRTNNGSVLISVYNRAEHFPKDAARYAVRTARLTIYQKTATVHFADLPAGKYAVAMMHDENNNLEMDYNMLGIPQEGFGFSNNAKGKFGPPSFEKAAVLINASRKNIRIKANYIFR